MMLIISHELLNYYYYDLLSLLNINRRELQNENKVIILCYFIYIQVTVFLVFSLISSLSDFASNVDHVMG